MDDPGARCGQARPLREAAREHGGGRDGDGGGESGRRPAADGGGHVSIQPNIQAVVEKLREKPPEEIWASFGFPLREPGNIRFDPSLGGGALLDVGTYTISLARWIYGEPDWVEATGRVEEVDMTVSMMLGFATGARAHLFASFDTPEVQELHAGDILVEKPFTAWRDPVDPYQVMVEEFSAAALGGLAAPLSLEDSIANLRVVDAVRRSLETGDRHHLAEAGEGLPPVAQ
jgi:predicted dehydrogenase